MHADVRQREQEHLARLCAALGWTREQLQAATDAHQAQRQAAQHARDRRAEVDAIRAHDAQIQQARIYMTRLDDDYRRAVA